MPELKELLEDLDQQIDAKVEEGLLADWRAFADGEWSGDLFVPQRQRPCPGRLEWPKVTINETLQDYDKMAMQQLSWCAGRLAVGNGHPLNVRCNYGTPIVPSLFGAELFVMDESANTLPACRPIGVDAVKAWLDKGVPDLDQGLCAKVWEMGERFMEIKRSYPNIGRYVFVYHPDFQGPLDILEMLWGSDIFLSFFDEPETIHAALELITETYRQLMRRWEKLTGQNQLTHVGHWEFIHRGRITLRDDSAMNLSPEMFDEFIRPYDEALLKEFGGGVIHSCGRVEHYVDRLPQMDGLYGFQMSQPSYNDMETVLANTVDRGIVLCDLSPRTGAELVKSGRELHGRVHCKKRLNGDGNV